MLKHKISTATILRYFDPAKDSVTFGYAIEWARYVSSNEERQNHTGDVHKSKSQVL